MAIEFTCPHCQTTIMAEQKYAGATGPCRSCGKSITIPGTPGPASAAPHTQSGAYVAPASSSSFPWLAVFAGIGCLGVMFVGVLVALLLPAVQVARTAARTAQTSGQEKQIVLALLNYESTNGQFPPAYTVDEEGKPMHSWRVLILPFLDLAPGSYDDYDMDQSWDSPHNMEVTREMPATFRCAQSEDQFGSLTSFLAIVGPNTVLQPNNGIRFQDLTDGTSQTVIFVDAHGHEVHWSEPVDLTTDQLGQLSPNMHRGIVTAFADGHVENLQSVAPHQVIINDGN